MEFVFDFLSADQEFPALHPAAFLHGVLHLAADSGLSSFLDRMKMPTYTRRQWKLVKWQAVESCSALAASLFNRTVVLRHFQLCSG